MVLLGISEDVAAHPYMSKHDSRQRSTSNEERPNKVNLLGFAQGG